MKDSDSRSEQQQHQEITLKREATQTKAAKTEERIVTKQTHTKFSVLVFSARVGQFEACSRRNVRAHLKCDKFQWGPQVLLLGMGLPDRSTDKNVVKESSEKSTVQKYSVPQLQQQNRCVCVDCLDSVCLGKFE